MTRAFSPKVGERQGCVRFAMTISGGFTCLCNACCFAGAVRGGRQRRGAASCGYHTLIRIEIRRPYYEHLPAHVRGAYNIHQPACAGLQWARRAFASLQRLGNRSIAAAAAAAAATPSYQGNDSPGRAFAAHTHLACECVCSLRRIPSS